MEQSSQPEQHLDQRFFHLTGIAMVFGTLIAGAIMVWLANDIGIKGAPVPITANAVSQTAAFQGPVTFSGSVNEVDVRVRSNKMASSLP